MLIVHNLSEILYKWLQSLIVWQLSVRNCVRIFLKHPKTPLNTPGLSCSVLLKSATSRHSIFDNGWLSCILYGNNDKSSRQIFHAAQAETPSVVPDGALFSWTCGYCLLCCTDNFFPANRCATFTFLRGLARLSRTLSVSSNCLRIR
jgi:hypothetical protein